MALTANTQIKDLDEALSILAADLDDDGIAYFKDNGEEFVVATAHHNLGQWLRNNWGLWEPPLTEAQIEQYKKMGLSDPLDWAGSRLVAFFYQLGIKEADDMSGIVIRSFHRLLSDKAMELEAQVNHLLSLQEP